MEEDKLYLTGEGAVDVARWTAAAWQSGHFDWNLIAGEDKTENVRERWALVRWLNDQGLLDCLDEPDPDDRELTAAIMLCFVTTQLRGKSDELGVTPQDWMDMTLGSADLLGDAA